MTVERFFKPSNRVCRLLASRLLYNEWNMFPFFEILARKGYPCLSSWNNHYFALAELYVYNWNATQYIDVDNIIVWVICTFIHIYLPMQMNTQLYNFQRLTNRVITVSCNRDDLNRVKLNRTYSACASFFVYLYLLLGFLLRFHHGMFMFTVRAFVKHSNKMDSISCPRRNRHFLRTFFT